MNNLSWFLYAADVLENLKPALGISLAVAGTTAALCLAGRAIEEWEPGPRYARMIAICAVPVVIVLCLIPSKSTMYAIAASQSGERIIADERVKGITDDAAKALHQWIKSQIEIGRKS